MSSNYPSKAFEHIAKLQERNRRRKTSEAQVDVHERRLSERESGFDTRFSGANRYRAQEKSALRRSRRRQRSKKAPAQGKRKTWDAPGAGEALFFHHEKGHCVPVVAAKSSDDEEGYSEDDFEDFTDDDAVEIHSNFAHTLPSKDIPRAELMLRKVLEAPLLENVALYTNRCASDVTYPTSEILLRVISTWGDTGVVGLTSVEIFDDAHNILKEAPLVSVAGCASEMNRPASFSRLFDGNNRTTNQQHMWMCKALERSQEKYLNVLLVITLPRPVCVGKMKIWNYNKSFVTSAVGVQRAQIFFVTSSGSPKLAWDGTVKRGCGNGVYDYSTIIEFTDAPLEQGKFKESAVKLQAQEKLREGSFKSSILFRRSWDEVSVDRSLSRSPKHSASRSSNTNAKTKSRLRYSAQHDTVDEADGMQRQDEVVDIVKRLRLSVEEADALRSSFEVEKIARKESFSCEQDDNCDVLFETDAESEFGSEADADDEAYVTWTLASEGNKCKVPALPRGSVITISILSTWGDPHYVGMNGIDVFCHDGSLLTLKSASVSADPADINVLPEYNSDPRVAENLLSFPQYTTDDLNMWLAPFYGKEHSHTITINLGGERTLSMVRFWNYNKSRIHSTRGVKDVCMSLDGVCIFKGRIKKAPGQMTSPWDCAETVLFTLDENILLRIQRSDTVSDFFEKGIDDVLGRIRNARPGTGDRSCRGAIVGAAKDGLEEERAAIISEYEERPPTGNAAKGDEMAISVRFNFTETWGDPFYMGLTGIELLTNERDALDLSNAAASISAQPSSINVNGHSGDPRTVDKLFDSVNVTCDDRHMWLIPYTAGGDHTLEIQFRQSARVTGFRIWNYNKNPDDVRRGAKRARVFIDGVERSPSNGILIRKALGTSEFDYAQTFMMTSISSANTTMLRDAPCSGTCFSMQDWVPPNHPCGHILRMDLLGTHGDEYYIGLQSVELYDTSGKLISQDTRPNMKIHAAPHSVNILKEFRRGGYAFDERVPEKLLNRDHASPSNCWLAPVAHTLQPGTWNKLYVTFDEPVALSMIKVYNYKKTVPRGANEIAIWMDESLIFRGYLRPAPKVSGPYNDYQVILFTNEPSVVNAHKRNVSYCGKKEQSVLFINNGKVCEGSSQAVSNTYKFIDPAHRPRTGNVRESNHS